MYQDRIILRLSELHEESFIAQTTSPWRVQMKQKQTERCHPDETRPFTVREYARIQTFPDEWIFDGSIAQQYKQIGNAVPVLMAEGIANKVKEMIK